MTLQQKEQQLNDYYASMNAAVVHARFLYLTDKQRKNRINNTPLYNAIRGGKMGTLLRKVDKDTFLELTKHFITE